MRRRLLSKTRTLCQTLPRRSTQIHLPLCSPYQSHKVATPNLRTCIRTLNYPKLISPQDVQMHLFLPSTSHLGPLAACIKQNHVACSEAIGRHAETYDAQIAHAGLTCVHAQSHSSCPNLARELTGRTEYTQQRDQRVDKYCSDLNTATMQCVSALAEMNLPAALNCEDNPDTLPDSLLTQSRIVREGGGIESLQRLMEGLEEPRRHIRDTLTEANRLLDLERHDDNEMRDLHGAKWTRQTSDELTQSVRAEHDKYQKWLSQATAGDQTIQSKFQENENGIAVLAKPEGELDQIIPSSGPPTRTPSGSDATGMDELRVVLSNLDAMRLERDTLTAELKSSQDKDDIVRLFLTREVGRCGSQCFVVQPALSDRCSYPVFLWYFCMGLLVIDDPHHRATNTRQVPKLLEHASGDKDHASIVAEQLAQYDTIGTRVNSAVADLEGAIDECRRANGVFVATRGSTHASEREGMLLDLGARFEAFKEIKSNLEEGTKFYTQLTGLVDKHLAKVQHLCEARRGEKQSNLSDITAAIASTPAATTYQSATAPPDTSALSHAQAQSASRSVSSESNGPSSAYQPPAPTHNAAPQYGYPASHTQPQPPTQSSYNPYAAPTAPTAVLQPQPQHQPQYSQTYGQPQAQAPPQYTPQQPQQPQYGQPQQPQYGQTPQAAPYGQQSYGQAPQQPQPGYQTAYGLPQVPPQVQAPGYNPAHPVGGGVPSVQYNAPPAQFNPVNPQRSGSAPDPSNWNCRACTFANSQLLTVCEMCGAAKP